MTRRIQILNLEDPGSFSPVVVNVGGTTREIQAGDYAEFSLSGQEAITVSEQRIHQKFDAKESAGTMRPGGTSALNFESTDDGKLKLADQEFGQEVAFDGNVITDFKRAGHMTQDGELFTLHTNDKTAVYRAIDTYPPNGFLLRLVSVSEHYDNGGPLAPGQVSDGAGTETMRPGEIEPTGQPGTQSVQNPKGGVMQGGAQVAGEPAGGGYYRGGAPLVGQTGVEGGQIADENGQPVGTGTEAGQGSTFLPGQGAEPAGGGYDRGGDPTAVSDENTDEGRAERLRTQDADHASDTAEDRAGIERNPEVDERTGTNYGERGAPNELVDRKDGTQRAPTNEDDTQHKAEDDEQPQRSDDSTSFPQGNDDEQPVDDTTEEEEASRGVPAPHPEPVYEASHRGNGNWSIMEVNSGREVKEGLKKAEATKFNALSDEEKAEYIKLESDTESNEDDASS